MRPRGLAAALATALASSLGTALATALALVAGAVALLALAAGPAAAHATLIGTDPAEGEVLPTAPERVTFTFNEPVSLTSDAVGVFDATGEPVEAEASGTGEELVAELPDLADGTYVVTYRVVSADGHPVAGSLSFSVGAPSETVVAPGVDLDAAPPAATSTALGVATAVAYLGLLVAAGLVLFTTRALAGTRVPEAGRARLHRLLRLATGIAVVGWLLRLPLVAAYQQGAGPLALVSGTSPDLGLLAADLVVTGAVLAGLLVALLVREPAWARLAAAAVALVAPALVGHTRAYEPVSLLVATDVVHLLAGATWLGGLVGLALTLPALAGRPADAAAVLARFSGWAASALGLVALTGSLLAWRILGSWSALTGTTYGRLLLVKIGVVALVAALAGVNRWRLLPKARTAVGHGEQQRATTALRGAVRVEAGLLVAAVALTGVLVNTSPRPEAAAAEPPPSRVAEAPAGEYRVLATLSPGRQGPNTLLVQVQDDGGEPLEVFAAPEVSFGNGEVDLGLLPLRPVGAGTYAAEVVLPAPGEWEAQVSLRATEFDNPVTLLTLTAR